MWAYQAKAGARQPAHPQPSCTRTAAWRACDTRTSGRHHSAASIRAHAARPDLASRTEAVIADIEAELSAESGDEEDELVIAQAKLSEIDEDIDSTYQKYFDVGELQLDDGSSRQVHGVSEREMQQLGRSEPKVAKALMAVARKRDPAAWRDFQSQVHDLKLTRTALERRVTALQESVPAPPAATAESGSSERPVLTGRTPGRVRVVLITGFESFNQDLYQRAAREVQTKFLGLDLCVFSDRDIDSRRSDIEATLDGADVFFASLLFDFDQVEWLKERVAEVPVRLVFESALELMSCTQVGSFEMAPGGKKAGPSAPVKKLLGLFGSQREEDRLAGYLSFLKVGPKVLKFLPMKKAQDLRSWLTIYGYWNEGGVDNIVSMLLYICNTFFQDTGAAPAEVQTTPQTGCLHPAASQYFESPAEYLTWYNKQGPLRNTAAPVVALLVYRKHVITKQDYIAELVTELEGQGLLPVPIFINGVEAHTVVRDLLTSADEAAALAAGAPRPQGLKRDAVQVDAVVSTIGFPLVGGPAGTMEGGRQAAVAKDILSAKNVPYFVAAPMLIQDLKSWVRDGIAGLQSVVLYSLPELDGAIDTVPLGGLVAGKIFLIRERVRRLCARINSWVTLRRKHAEERKVAVLLYGFPPGVGATGTAALLNVPRSLERTLQAMRDAGYDLGDAPEDLSGYGDAIVAALKEQEQPGVITRGAAAVQRIAVATGASSVAAEVPPRELRTALHFDEHWGPTEWGPIPFLPKPDLLVEAMENAWGDLYKYRGLNSTANGNLLVAGVQVGNVWIGVQPLLGIEGDPMRLLFDRDLTPHPQYAAFYHWLQHSYQADAVVHFGMHGTVEWLPGQPLGNSGLSWSDVLLGGMPNVYVYAANNPSESIIAKRRGYGTIISHNVPPYGRAGLYKQLSELQNLLSEYRESPAENESLRAPIIDMLATSGLDQDCPYSDREELTGDNVEAVAAADFSAYADRLYRYLQEVSNRLFSEGLHHLGAAPTAEGLNSYLSAYLGGRLPDAAIEQIAHTPHDQLAAVRQLLERQYAEPAAQRNTQSTGGAEMQKGSSLAAVQEGFEVRELLEQNTQELDSFIRALNGEYVLPEAGGDLLRDGPGVLPTGRNIHALDPYRMPSLAAEERGYQAAAAILESHQAANAGAYPETVAVNLWGLDAIKTKGESVAMAIWLVGARPVKEGTGRIARFELLSLEELGRPRIDVLCNMSGIFRDSFQNVVELLDDMFQRAAAAPEPPERNFVRAHADAMRSDNPAVDNPAARLFSNPAGDYGSMVNERVGASDWTSAAELGDTWSSRNAFSYGRGDERGAARGDVLQSLLTSTERVVQQVDSVEYGLTDIQEYYANTGALKAAAQAAKGEGGAEVGCSVVEAFGKDVKPKELDEVLRLEYRSKLLNPKWAKAMAAQGSGGAYEISQRMTAMLGWGGTVGFAEDWTWNQACETYVEDAEMAAKLRENNPQAYRNALARMLEASGRGLWQADSNRLAKLQEMYSDMDEQLEKGQQR